MTCKHGEQSPFCNLCDIERISKEQASTGSSELTSVTTTRDCLTHEQKMLDELYNAERWHDDKARYSFGKSTKEFHRKFEQAIWWAIQNLDDEIVTYRVREKP